MNWDGKERRKYVRRKIPCNIFVSTPDEHLVYTYTEDISENGVKVAIEEELPVGSRVYVEIYLEEEPIFCKGEVKWVQCVLGQDGNNKFKTGIEIKSREHI